MAIGTYIRAGVGLAFVLLLAWALRLDHLRGHWRDKFDVLSNEATAVLVSLRDMTGKPKLKWQDVPQQLDLLDKSLTEKTEALDQQTAAVNQLGAETARLQAENAAMAKKIAALNRKRDQLIRRLEDDAMEPGDRADCWAQVKAAEDALNLLYREGF